MIKKDIDGNIDFRSLCEAAIINITGIDQDADAIEWNTDTTPEITNPDIIVKTAVDIKEKLDIIVSQYSNSVQSPQTDYIKALLTTELEEFLNTLNEYVYNINNAINVKQMDNQLLSTGTSTNCILSIPLNEI